MGPSNGFPGRRTALFYAEALRRYGYLLEEENLEKAYDRAQMFFTGVLSTAYVWPAFSLFSLSILFSPFLGELESTFLVLREKGAIKRLKVREAARGPPPPPPVVLEEPVPSRGVKRSASDDGHLDSKRLQRSAFYFMLA